MAKRRKKTVPANTSAKSKFVPDPCATVKQQLRHAAGIAAQILVHFGAGFGAQRQIMSPGTNAQIFDHPSTPDAFTDLLITSIIKHYADLHWDTDAAGRDAICRTAFKHGKLACQYTSGAAVDWHVLYATHQEIKASTCPVPSAGGGIACDF